MFIGSWTGGGRGTGRPLRLDGKYKEMAKTDKNFSSLRDDPDFKVLTG